MGLQAIIEWYCGPLSKQRLVLLGVNCGPTFKYTNAYGQSVVSAISDQIAHTKPRGSSNAHTFKQADRI